MSQHASVGYVGGYISVPLWTQIWWIRTWVQNSSRTSVGAFLPLRPKPMLGPETRASVRLKKGYTVIDGTRSHQKDPTNQ